MSVEGLKVRAIEFGIGKPKICVPIVARKREDILFQVEEALKREPDCIELRIDWYEEVFDTEKVLELVKEIRERLGNVVFLFTYRTANEGGEAATHYKAYRELCKAVCESGYIDMIDVEAYMEEGLLKTMVDVAHSRQVFVVASNHDFHNTPSEEEIVKRLQFMDGSGADIPKIAVMPRNERDVLTLLSATLRYRELGGVKPVITMSMGGTGTVSRLAGEVFGSAMTFAAVNRVSAPGQLSVDDVKYVLDIMHTKRER